MRTYTEKNVNKGQLIVDYWKLDCSTYIQNSSIFTEKIVLLLIASTCVIEATWSNGWKKPIDPMGCN